MSICTAPVYRLEELNNLFIDLTSKNCNQRCSSCYIDFPPNRKIKDFIPIDMIKEALSDTKNEDIYCIYLTGAEPMTHPDFNSILRLCLKRSNVCICTNASFLNEKKIRFLKKVEDEGSTQIFFKLSLCHYDELLSDKARYRGNYRQTISALKTAGRYNFTSVLSIQNCYNLPKNELKENFKRIFEINEICHADLQINVSYPLADNIKEIQNVIHPDCTKGRILNSKGVYACPFLSGDYRGRVGSTFKNYSKSVSAETDFCTACSANGNMMFAVG